MDKVSGESNFLLQILQNPQTDFDETLITTTAYFTPDTQNFTKLLRRWCYLAFSYNTEYVSLHGCVQCTDKIPANITLL